MTSSTARVTNLCFWCKKGPVLRKYCSQKCRQAAFRSRRLIEVYGPEDEPKRLCYADPPFPGLSSKYYGDEPSFAGEVDHVKLVKSLGQFDGWALSTSHDALRYVLGLIPSWVEVEVCPWVKLHMRQKSKGPANVHEYVIVKPARVLMPGPRDALIAQAARHGGTLPGRKPIKFVNWMFRLLGASPGDELTDMFPGTGIVSRCWAEFQRH